VKKLVEGILERLLGRLPIGWLQLIHNRSRLLAAVAGVTFANVLVFMQLGFRGALVTSIEFPYRAMNADVLLSATDMNTLADGSPIPRQRMFQALSVDEVISAAPVYYGKTDWRQADGTVRNLDVFGVDPSKDTFDNSKIRELRSQLALLDVAIIDRGTRNVSKATFDAIDAGHPPDFEARGRTLRLVGTFTIGGGFSSDGYLIVSDQTFLRLFPQRVSGAPNHVFLRLDPRANRDVVLAKLRAAISPSDVIVRSVEETARHDQSFQTTQRPVGIVFGFGVVIGIFVGVIIVYQVLTTDVADHMNEYATFKALGYRQRFFLSIVLEEAILLAILGSIPGVLISVGLYALASRATSLPLRMDLPRAAAVFLGTVLMCALSGAFATRRLARANPAELFG
jgi:putative ABC transport system permease protein